MGYEADIQGFLTSPVSSREERSRRNGGIDPLYAMPDEYMVGEKNLPVLESTDPGNLLKPGVKKVGKRTYGSISDPIECYYIAQLESVESYIDEEEGSVHTNNDWQPVPESVEKLDEVWGKIRRIQC